MGCAGTPLLCVGISFFWTALALAVVWIFEGVIWTFAFACAGARSASLDLSAECMHYIDHVRLGSSAGGSAVVTGLGFACVMIMPCAPHLEGAAMGLAGTGLRATCMD